jgi:hypothetical protein
MLQWSEYQPPQKCRVPEVCLGVDSARAAELAMSGSDPSDTLNQLTQACAAGYEGQKCGACRPV